MVRRPLPGHPGTANEYFAKRPQVTEGPGACASLVSTLTSCRCAVCVRAQLACVLQPVLWLNRSRLGVLAPQRLKLTGKKPPFLKLTAGAVTLVRRRQLCTPDVAHLSEAMCFYLATGGCRVRHSRCAELKNGLPCGSATAAENACLQGWSLVNDSGVHMWSQGSFLTTAWRDAARLLPAAAGCWCLAPAQVQAWCNIHA